MTAYFCWVRNRIGRVEPQVFRLDLKPKAADGCRIVRQHALSDPEDTFSIDSLMVIYPYVPSPEEEQ